MLVRMWTEGLCTAEQIHILSGRVLTSICYLEGNQAQPLCDQRWCVGEMTSVQHAVITALFVDSCSLEDWCVSLTFG